MKFSSYLVEFKHNETSLTGSLMIQGEPVSATFNKIESDLFIVQFKTQVAFTFKEKVHFKSGDKDILILLPVITKYNKRKLAKLSKILSESENLDRFQVLDSLVNIDKFVKVEELLNFFGIQWAEALDYLLEKELRKEVKVIGITGLVITSWENLQAFLQQLNVIFTECYTSRSKSLKYSEIETRIKIPQSSKFFKYLIGTFTKTFSLQLKRDRIIFSKVSLSENEQGALALVSEILEENKLTIFTIDNLLSLSDTLILKEINDTLWFLIERGKVVRLNDRFFIFKEDLEKIINKLKKYKRNEGEIIDIKTFRELTLYSRKYIICLFEYFDSVQITERVENQRRILLGA